MLERLARALVRRRRPVLVVAVMVFIAAGVIGGGVVSVLSSGGFDDPNAESSRAADLLEERFDQGVPNLLVLVTADGSSVDDPAVRDAGLRLTAELSAEAAVTDVVSYWSLGNAPPLANRAGDRALVIARIEGDEDEVREQIEDLAPRYTRDLGATEVRVGGFAEVFREVSETVEADLTRAELIALPLTLILLLFVFGSVVAASLPLAVGGFAVVGTFLILRVLAGLTDVSIFALNLTTALGLGLAIDYSLFIVSRFREELRHGFAPAEAVVRTVRTAGRTVLFSAVAVAVSLAALLVFPLDFLRSFAYAGIGVAFTAAIGAVIVLPALLAVLGHRVDKWTVWRRRRHATGPGGWHRIAMAVMRRPIPIAAAVVAVLLVLGVPFLGIEFGLPDDRVLPAKTAPRQVHDAIREEFESQEAAALQVVAPDAGDPSARGPEIDAYASRLSRLAGAARVDAHTGSYIDGRKVLPAGPQSARFSPPDGGGTWLSVVPNVEPMSKDAEALVGAIRAADAPFAVLVAGPSAELKDSKSSLFGRIPLAAGLIALVMFTVLFLMFGGLLVPAKALVLNLLSLSATFGAMVWVFQEGNLAGLLDFTPTGTIESSMPILMFCVAFGLSMDYEVFLLSRIKEEHDRTGDNVSSVALGLERTGGIVTAAALIISVVFIAFATSNVTFIKLFGVGLALAVLMDAFLIRATLVPAFMRLAGEANWWAPRSMRRLQRRIGLTDHVALDEPADERREAGGADDDELMGVRS